MYSPTGSFVQGNTPQLFYGGNAGVSPQAVSYTPTSAVPQSYIQQPTYIGQPQQFTAQSYVPQTQYYAAPQYQQVQYVQPVQQFQQHYEELREIKMQKPKVDYTSQYISVPKTIQVPQTVKEKAVRMVPKETFETKMVAIQVPRTIMVPSVSEVDVEIMVPEIQYVEREIKIPEPVMETKVIKVPKQRIVVEEEEETHEQPAMEEYYETVRVPTTTYTTQAVYPTNYASPPAAYGYPINTTSGIYPGSSLAYHPGGVQPQNFASFAPPSPTYARTP